MKNTNNTLNLLLNTEQLNPETAEIKISRLSQAAGGDIIFKLKGLGYSRVAEIKELNDTQEAAIQTVLAGVTAPNLNDAALLEKFHAVTPSDLIKSMLIPGEVESICRRIQRLSGYLTDTIEDV